MVKKKVIEFGCAMYRKFSQIFNSPPKKYFALEHVKLDYSEDVNELLQMSNFSFSRRVTPKEHNS